MVRRRAWRQRREAQLSS
ncbi:UDP-N-acetylglucosamine--N-acetylmuramyl- (pentapeptide) pyrophosphoryl-undecaprenol N-acetylglucosamine transferase [Caballeronia sordidicola]|uniref:UDP-N-acetylglucosamine--N-acetylmuramyl-(Pentapeptide) pyrophosphoryl-undecaprenol N-acetylglucosamine transferase n=1 Tax=Caballeronia sordidicola TaxID=196367 RepID=A0A242MCQ3_CABSO|nr:UDP-N-acetylglucosamine--N-acetylmuramyl- (pentapeptide) pyrophosphoryl-undecaprenol N-acetylglucosamine transferase [Caballeronia sordidicola]